MSAAKYSPGELEVVYKAINAALGSLGKPLWLNHEAVSVTTIWLNEVHSHYYSHIKPPVENVCRQLYLIYRNLRNTPNLSRDAISAMLHLQCSGSTPVPGISHNDMILIYQAIDHEVDPGVPVDLDFWLNPRERDDLCYVLKQYKKYRADAATQADLAYLLGRLCSVQAQPRSEKDRLRDFFFGKPGSRKARGLSDLPGWRRRVYK